MPAAEHEAALRKCEQLQETVWELEELRRSQVTTTPAQHPPLMTAMIVTCLRIHRC